MSPPPVSTSNSSLLSMPLPPSLSRPPSSLAWTMAVDSRWHSGSPLLPCSWVRNSQYQRGLFKIYHLKSSHYWDFPVVQWLRRACMLSLLNHVRLHDPVDCSPLAPLSMGFSSKNTGVGCHILLQGIFPIQGSNPHLLCLPHWQAGFFSSSATWEALGNPSFLPNG